MRRPQLRHVFLALAVMTTCAVSCAEEHRVALPAPAPAVAELDVATVQAVEAVAPATLTDRAPTASLTLLEREMQDGGDPLHDHKADARAALKDGKLPEAIASWRRALATDASADVWGALGDAYLKHGDVERGLACLREAVSLDVHHLASRKALTRHFLDNSAGELARQQAEEWVRLEPQSAQARQALARSYTQLGMWKEAIDGYAIVLTTQPDNAYAHNNLGYAALQVGDTTLALAHLERVPALRPQHGYMFNNLGVAYERSGRPAEAHAAFARAAELAPKYQLAALNRDRLQRGLDHAQRLVAADTLLRLRDGEAHAVMPLGGDAPVLDLPAMP